MTRAEVLESTKWSQLMAMPNANKFAYVQLHLDNSMILFEDWDIVTGSLANAAHLLPASGDIMIGDLANGAPDTSTPPVVIQKFHFLHFTG